MAGEHQQAVYEAIARQKRLPLSEIHADSSLESLGISSLEAITIMYELEEIFSVQVENEALQDLHTVQDVVSEIGRLIEAKP